MCFILYVSYHMYLCICIRYVNYDILISKGMYVCMCIYAYIHTNTCIYVNV